MKPALGISAILTIFACSVGSAQQPSGATPNSLSYENGTIANNVYTNECFGFSLPIPGGWQTNTQILGRDGKGKHASGQLVLLMLELQKEGSFGSRVALSVPDVRPTAPTAESFVSDSVHGQISVDREHRELLRDTYDVDYGGKHFFRADSKQTLGGRVLYVASVFTTFRGYYVGGTLIADSADALEQAANTLRQISFRDDTPNPDCVMNEADTQPSFSERPTRIRVSEKVSQGLLIKKVTPEYPPMARASRIQGQVVLRAVIAENGDVEELTLVSGHPMLAPAALEAVKRWKYKPYLLQGKPVKVDTQIVVNSSLFF